MKDPEFEIDKGVPVPTTYGGRKKYPFGQMKIGDSFLVKGNHDIATRARSAAYVYGHSHKMKFTVRTTKEGARVWRVA